MEGRQVNRQLWVNSSLFPEGLRPIVAVLTDERQGQGSKNFGWDKDFPTPNTSPAASPPRKARPLLINVSVSSDC